MSLTSGAPAPRKERGGDEAALEEVGKRRERFGFAPPACNRGKAQPMSFSNAAGTSVIPTRY